MELVIPNQSHIYFCLPEVSKTNLQNQFLGTKKQFEFVFFFCKSTMYNVYIEHLIFLKVKTCSVFREFLTFNAY